MKKILLVILILISFSGCSTIGGIGSDIKSTYTFIKGMMPDSEKCDCDCGSITSEK